MRTDRRKRTRVWIGASIAALVVLCAALGWLSWTLVEQDREIAAARVQERLAGAADLAVAALDRRLSTVEERLATIAEAADPTRATAASGLLTASPSHDGVVLVMTSREVWSSAPLLYYPVVPPEPDDSAAHFAEAERLEFGDGQMANALPLLRTLARSSDRHVRAGALARIARIARNLGEDDEALEAYRALSGIEGATALGRQADLVAAVGRGDVLEDLGRADALGSAATDLHEALMNGRWRLTRAQFQFYRTLLEGWRGKTTLDPLTDDRAIARASLAAGAHTAWQAAFGVEASSHAGRGRQIYVHEGRQGLLIWRSGTRGVAALVTTAKGAASVWRDELAAIEERHGVRITVSDDQNPWIGSDLSDNALDRPARTSGLPLSIRVASAAPNDAPRFAQERGTLIALIAAAGAIVLLGGYLSARGLAREAAALRLQSDFVSAVSHEFRTPVASVRQLSEMLDDKRVTDDARRSEYYGLLRREGIRLQRLVENLLDFGRMEAGAAEYRMEPVDLHPFLDELVGDFSEEVRLSGRRVELMVSTALPTIEADREALGRAVWNLLDNAAKYSPVDSAISVEARTDGGRVTIRVHDDGPGIPRDEQQRIFDRFVRGADARASGAKGTGLGLAMVRHIVTAHGGQVRVDSTPGRGSTFIIELTS
jgi:signal transduction histidine kinase